MKFPFEDTPDVAVITCFHIVKNNAPILYVSHDDDGSWQFLCGEHHKESDAMIVSLSEIYELDNSIAELSKMSCGYYAERLNYGKNWIIKKG